MDIKQVLLAQVINLLRPLVRILLQNGVPYETFGELARWVYVDVASREFGIPGRKQTVSRISVITGLSRKEVVRLKAHPRPQVHSIQAFNRAARVISGWVRDHVASDGSIAPLPLEGAGHSFAGLVRRYSGDMPVRAVLDELVRVGAVERLGDGQLRLLSRAYLPRTGDPEKLTVLGRDVGDLISTIEHNLRAGPSDAYFQRIVAYDNLPAEFLATLRQDAARRGQVLLEDLDQQMSAKDRDIDPTVGGTGRKRAVIGIYYFEEDAKPNSQ